MPTLAVPDCCKAEVFYTLDGQRIENTLHWFRSGTWGATEMGTLGAGLLTWVTTKLMPYLSQNIQFRYVQLTDLRTLDGGSVPVIPAAPVDGGVAADALPNNCAFCVAFSTGGRGRSSRGRNYVPGLDEDSVVGSIVSSGRGDQILNAYLQLLPDGDSPPAGWTWCLVSRTFNGVQRNPPVTPTIVSAYYSDLVMDSQRRRLPRRGS